MLRAFRFSNYKFQLVRHGDKALRQMGLRRGTGRQTERERRGMDASDNHQLSQIQSEISDVRAELRELASLVSDLLRAIRPRADAKVCRWPDVAVMLGISGPNAAGRARERIRYQNDKPDGYAIRTTHGGCFRADLLRHIEREAERRTGRGERVRAAIKTT